MGQKGERIPSIEVVAKAAARVAELAGIELAPHRTFLIVEEDGVGAAHPFWGEKLAVVLAPMAAKGLIFRPIGFTKGGRNSKIHAIGAKQCRPWLLIITPGNMADGLMPTEPALLGKRR